MLRVTGGGGGLRPTRNQFQNCALGVTHFAVVNLGLFGSLLEERRQVSEHFSRKMILFSTIVPSPKKDRSLTFTANHVIRVFFLTFTRP
jgi:hypothetical protein